MRENLSSHSPQLYGLSRVCVNNSLFKVDEWANALSQTSQEHNFSPARNIKWLFKLHNWENVFLQILQPQGFPLVWTSKWFFKLLVCSVSVDEWRVRCLGHANVISQNSQLYGLSLSIQCTSGVGLHWESLVCSSLTSNPMVWSHRQFLDLERDSHYRLPLSSVRTTFSFRRYSPSWLMCRLHKKRLSLTE